MEMINNINEYFLSPNSKKEKYYNIDIDIINP